MFPESPCAAVQVAPPLCSQGAVYLPSRGLMCSVVSDSLQPFGLQPTRLLCPWDFPGKNTGMGCHFLLQGIFPTQGSNQYLLYLLHCRWILYLLSHRGSPEDLKPAVIYFFIGSFSHEPVRPLRVTTLSLHAWMPVVSLALSRT